MAGSKAPVTMLAIREQAKSFHRARRQQPPPQQQVVRRRPKTKKQKPPALPSRSSRRSVSPAPLPPPPTRPPATTSMMAARRTPTRTRTSRPAPPTMMVRRGTGGAPRGASRQRSTSPLPLPPPPPMTEPSPRDERLMVLRDRVRATQEKWATTADASAQGSRGAGGSSGALASSSSSSSSNRDVVNSFADFSKQQQQRADRLLGMRNGVAAPAPALAPSKSGNTGAPGRRAMSGGGRRAVAAQVSGPRSPGSGSGFRSTVLFGARASGGTKQQPNWETNTASSAASDPFFDRRKHVYADGDAAAPVAAGFGTNADRFVDELKHSSSPGEARQRMIDRSRIAAAFQKHDIDFNGTIPRADLLQTLGYLGIDVRQPRQAGSGMDTVARIALGGKPTDLVDYTQVSDLLDVMHSGHETASSIAAIQATVVQPDPEAAPHQHQQEQAATPGRPRRNSPAKVPAWGQAPPIPKDTAFELRDMAAQAGRGIAVPRLLKALRDADTDLDGKVTHREFDHVILGLGLDVELPRMRRLVTSLDTDGDGLIDTYALAEALQGAQASSATPAPSSLPTPAFRTVRRTKRGAGAGIQDQHVAGGHEAWLAMHGGHVTQESYAGDLNEEGVLTAGLMPGADVAPAFVGRKHFFVPDAVRTIEEAESASTVPPPPASSQSRPAVDRATAEALRKVRTRATEIGFRKRKDSGSARHVFLQADTNRDSMLNEHEFRNGLRDLHVAELSERDISALWRYADWDRKGIVAHHDINEFIGGEAVRAAHDMHAVRRQRTAKETPATRGHLVLGPGGLGARATVRKSGKRQVFRGSVEGAAGTLTPGLARPQSPRKGARGSIGDAKAGAALKAGFDFERAGFWNPKTADSPMTSLMRWNVDDLITKAPEMVHHSPAAGSRAQPSMRAQEAKRDRDIVGRIVERLEVKSRNIRKALKTYVDDGRGSLNGQKVTPAKFRQGLDKLGVALDDKDYSRLMTLVSTQGDGDGDGGRGRVVDMTKMNQLMDLKVWGTASVPRHRTASTEKMVVMAPDSTLRVNLGKGRVDPEVYQQISRSNHLAGASMEILAGGTAQDAVVHRKGRPGNVSVGAMTAGHLQGGAVVVKASNKAVSQEERMAAQHGRGRRRVPTQCGRDHLVGSGAIYYHTRPHGKGHRVAQPTGRPSWWG